MATKTNSADGKLVKGTSKADSITNSGNNVTINAGGGNDYVYNTGSDVTIDGGAGDDTVYAYGYNVLVKYSGGNDSIQGFDTTDTLQIASGTMNSVINSNGKDLFLTVGENIITLESAARIADSLNVVNAKGKKIKYSINPQFNVTSGNDSVTNYLSNVTLNAGKGNDTIWNYGSNATINTSSGKDRIINSGNYVTIDAGTGNDNITNSGENVTINMGAGNDSIHNSDGYVTIDGGADNDLIINNGVHGSNVSINGGAGNDSIVNGAKWGELIEDNSNVTLNGGAGNDYIYNDGYKVTIDGGAGDDTIENTLVYAGSNKGADVLFVYSGGNDSIQGFDTTSTLKIASGTMNSVINSNGKDLFLTVGENIITLAGAARRADSLNIVNAKGKAVKYSVNPPKFNFTSGDDSVSNSFSDVTLNAGKGNDTIYNSGFHNVSINGSAGNDYIYNGVFEENSFAVGVENITIEAGSGKDYIYDFASEKTSISGGAGNDTVFLDGRSYGVTKYATVNAGAGNDIVSLSSYAEDNVIQYASGDGNDIVYGLGTNTLSIANGKGTYSAKKSDSDIVVTVGKGKITLVGAASLSAVHINNDIILTNESKSPVTVDSSVKTIDASARTTAIKITGNSKANMIFGGSKADTLIGGKGNDSLWGGKGNDKLYGGDGKDTFIYKPGEGTDTIFDYASGDVLKILKSDGTEGGTFTDSSFSDNKLTLTIDGGGKVIFDNVSASDTFNINGTTHKISGKKLG